MILLLFFLFLLPFPIHTLDSETNDPVYKFVIESGEPVTLNASDIIEVGNFDECIEKCEEDYECVMVYQSNSSDPCYLFKWNSILEVTRNESGGVGTVGFKVYTDQPSCDLNSQFLLNGKTYPIYPNDTSIYLWKIDTSETGWTITYLNQREDANLVCGNFTYNRPYPDGCNPECNLTMVQVSGVPGPITRAAVEINETQKMPCIMNCFQNPDCFVVYFNENLKKCSWYGIHSIWFVNRTEAADGNHIAIKLPLSNRSCKLTTDQLLNDQYYLPHMKIRQAWIKSFFRVRTTPKYYKFSFYLDEKNQLVRMNIGCEMHTVSTVYRDGLTVCARLHNTPNITYNAAKEICHEMDGKLMPERIYPALRESCFLPNTNHHSDTAYAPSSMVQAWGPPYQGQYGFYEQYQEQSSVPYTFWMGLEKDQATGQFKWEAPEWVVTNGATFDICGLSKTYTEPFYTWAPGQPVGQPGLDCAYLKWNGYQSTFPGYGLYNAKCDTDVADGFMCGTLSQPMKGIPSADTICAEYGVEIERGGYYQYW